MPNTQSYENVEMTLFRSPATARVCPDDGFFNIWRDKDGQWAGTYSTTRKIADTKRGRNYNPDHCVVYRIRIKLKRPTRV